MTKLKIKARGITAVERANVYGKIVRHLNDVATKSGQREILVNLVGEFLKQQIGADDLDATAREFFRDVLDTMGLREQVEGQAPRIDPKTS